MNTNNLTLLGYTLPTGPFSFMDVYDPSFSPNKGDEDNLFAYEKQPQQMLWSLGELGKALAFLCGRDINGLVTAHTPRHGECIVQEILDGYEDVFLNKYIHIMRKVG
jgi:uncharacterized protein YdiU (UPF0061 family)